MKSKKTNIEETQLLSQRMFKNPLLEKISRTNPYVVIISFFIMSIGFTTYGAMNVHTSWYLMILLFVLGYFAFTLAEYSVHRFSYHKGDYKNQKNWNYKVHGFHHHHPRDKERLAMPLILALILSAIFFSFFWLLMGNYTFFFFPGFTFGYGLYLFFHNLIHTIKPPNNFFKYMWTHHSLHHYKYEDKAFGVSTPFWDYVFNTMPPKN